MGYVLSRALAIYSNLRITEIVAAVVEDFTHGKETAGGGLRLGVAEPVVALAAKMEGLAGM